MNGIITTEVDDHQHVDEQRCDRSHRLQSWRLPSSCRLTAHRIVLPAGSCARYFFTSASGCVGHCAQIRIPASARTLWVGCVGVTDKHRRGACAESRPDPQAAVPLWMASPGLKGIQRVHAILRNFAAPPDTHCRSWHRSRTSGLPDWTTTPGATGSTPSLSAHFTCAQSSPTSM